MTWPLALLRPRRSIVGMSAILLPHRSSVEVDWPGFEAHVTRTADAGLTPAVNMDTGFVHLLTPEQRAEVLSRTRSLGVEFVAGAFDEADVEAVQALGGTPVLFPSEHTADVVPAYQRVAESADRFIGFELSPLFHPDGRIWDLETYRAVIAIPQCIGAKHSSLERSLEWDRLRLRDEVRSEFLVLTGNDLAIDMVMYGSDYLLGLSTFAPAEFAARDRAWAEGDLDGFHRRNDVLQWLGTTAFRPPVPAYRHDAALFLQLRGWTDTDATPDGAPRRPAWERELLASILAALEAA
ncbi:MAG: dihydrodipicolinate synthase family protein [Acidimicrobiales bacterium]